MNFWLFGLFYLIYTLFLIIIGVVLLKKFGKNFIYKYYENKLEKYFDDYNKEDSVEDFFHSVSDSVGNTLNEISEEE